MPRNRRPSFLTKQKEQKRRAKANEKREARRARRERNKGRGADQAGDLDEPAIADGGAPSAETPVEPDEAHQEEQPE